MKTDSLLSLLWWVGIALAFFWLMRRGGCGMMAHGDRHARAPDGDSERERLERLRAVAGKPVDPVCQMEVEPGRAAGTRVASGHTYFFCSKMCLDTFDKNPDLYAASGHVDGHEHAGC